MLQVLELSPQQRAEHLKHQTNPTTRQSPLTGGSYKRASIPASASKPRHVDSAKSSAQARIRSRSLKPRQRLLLASGHAITLRSRLLLLLRSWLYFLKLCFQTVFETVVELLCCPFHDLHGISDARLQPGINSFCPLWRPWAAPMLLAEGGERGAGGPNSSERSSMLKRGQHKLNQEHAVYDGRMG